MKHIRITFFTLFAFIIISYILSGNYFCRVGSYTCKTAKNAIDQMKSREQAYSSRRIPVYRNNIDIHHPLATYLATPSCIETIFKPLRQLSTVTLFENNDKIELRIGYESFFSLNTIEEVKARNLKKLIFENETTYVSSPNPQLLVTIDMSPARQISIAVINDNEKAHPINDIKPCLSLDIPEDHSKAIEILGMI